MNRLNIALFGCAILAGGSLSAADNEMPPDQIEFFESRIRPILMEHCLKCHGGEKVKKGLQVNTLKALFTGGDSGPALKPGDPHNSLIMQALKGEGDMEPMPPRKPMPASVIKDFEKWIAMGAPWPNTDKDVAGIDTSKPRPWSFSDLKPVTPPKIEQESLARNPIDHFILHDLQAAGLSPGPEADKHTLIRRATYDLTGLPPSMEEVEAFVQDDRPEAWSELLERLLNSKAYGERWGRHWMDVVRYADTSGDGTDMPVPEAARYRDYIIQSFNEDLPYNDFLKEQIAGDILFRKDPGTRPRERLTATSYIGLTRRFGNGFYQKDPLMIDNTIEVIGKGLLGIGMHCARCHDHKFDPVSIDDYYAFYGYFKSTQYPHAGSERGKARVMFVPLVEDVEELDRYREIGQFLLQNQRELDKMKTDRVHSNFKKSVAPIEKKIAANKKNSRSDEALRELEKQKAELVKERDRKLDMLKRSEEITADFEKNDLVFGVTDKFGGVNDAHILLAGKLNKPGPIVKRGYISALDDSIPDIPENESGRLQLAEWIVSPDNPLTARVMANRIWLYHFGSGIVPTPDNFGNQGEKPTHPELLDWLAREFIRHDWSIKDMHRLIMNSATYRRSSDAITQNMETDPGNTLYWRYQPRRLSAEAIRDSMLVISGTLDTSPQPPHPYQKGYFRNYTQHHPFTEDFDHKRRSVYLPTRRLGNHPLYTLFDGPDTNTTTGRRQVSTVPQQALYAVNSEFMASTADALARRITNYTNDPDDRIVYAWQLVYQREPSSAETRRTTGYLDRYAELAGQDRHAGWVSLARTLLVSNEALYLR